MSEILDDTDAAFWCQRCGMRHEDCECEQFGSEFDVDEMDDATDEF